MRFISVSDTHFGSAKKDEEKYSENVRWIIREIEKKNPDELILNGDIIDTFYYRNIESNPHRDLFYELLDSHDKISYIAGNHDIIYKKQKRMGKAEVKYPFYVTNEIMFIHGHIFDIFHVFPFFYSDIDRVTSYIDRFWELCPYLFAKVDEIYTDMEYAERIKYNITSMRTRTFLKVIMRVFPKVIYEGKLQSTSAATFSILSMVFPKILLGVPFYSQNPGVLDSKLYTYGRKWSDELFDTVCYGHIHIPFLIRGTYFSFANSGFVDSSHASYVYTDGKKISVEKL